MNIISKLHKREENNSPSANISGCMYAEVVCCLH